MRLENLTAALRRLKVQTGSLACLGCGHEHDCGVHGCRILQEAIKELETLSGPECGRIDVERLTELHYKKSDGYYARCSEHCNDICDCNCEKRGEILDRLGAYEDTGLEPEEIEKNKQDVEAGYLKVTARRYGIDVSRLRELAEADRKGRCVVLPCKIGDTLNKCVNQAREFEELYRKLYAATGFTAEKLLEMFAAGYVLQKPDYSKQLAEMANLAEAEAALREG